MKKDIRVDMKKIQKMNILLCLLVLSELNQENEASDKTRQVTAYEVYLSKRHPDDPNVWQRPQYVREQRENCPEENLGNCDMTCDDDFDCPVDDICCLNRCVYACHSLGF